MDEPSHILVRRAQQHDTTAANMLFRRYRDRLRHGLRRLLGDRYRALHFDSEDAVQDAILSALRRLDDFDYRGDGSFLAWLLMSARLEVLQRIKEANAKKRDAGDGRRLESVDEQEAAGASPSECAEGRELEERVQEILDQMPDRERQVILLRRYVGLEVEEIREELGMPTPGSVRALLSRAQTKLARELDLGDLQ